MEVSPTDPGPQVADAAQAALLLDVRLRPMLSLLMHHPSSATEVAGTLGITVKRAHYLLTRLEQAGIAHVVALETRRGRPIRRYGTAERWFIPFEITGAETLEAFLGEQILPRMAGFVRLSAQRLQEYSPEWGYWLEKGEQASNLRIGDRQGTANDLYFGDEPYLLTVGTAHLSREQASQLKQRLIGVMREFDGLEDPAAPAYTLALLMVRGDVG